MKRDESDGNDQGANTYPLGWDLNGNPVAMPEEAAGWRVTWRKIGERGGSPSLVYSNGRPLVLPLDATADDLISQVDGRPGRYRLDPVDEAGRTFDGAAPAYSVIEKQIHVGAAAVERQSDPMQDVMARLLTAMETLAKQSAETTAAIAAQSAAMMGAASNMIAVASGRPIEVVTTAPEPPRNGNGGGFDWGAFMTAFAPSIGPMLQNLMSLLEAKVSASAPSAPVAK